MTTFYELGLSHPLHRAIEKMGFEETTPIQAQSIPIVMNGKDMIGQAQTGTGKTAAFGVPMIERVNVEWPDIQGMVITPTRELAMQVAEELNRIGQFKQVQTLPVYGGQDISRQIRALKKKPRVIVGTPGRLLDHIRRGTIKLGNLQMIVLDEADEMLDMGFIDDIENILESVPDQRQTLLFSATMPSRIQSLAQKFMKDPETVRIKAKEMTVTSVEQHYIEIHEKQKFDVLCLLLDIQSPELAIVFGRTKRRVDELSEALSKRGYSAEGLHGDLSQPKRDRVMGMFKSEQIEVLIATDVAARGLDITGVTHVYNFDIPQDAESYVHRIGRTGRAGKSGLATTFVTPREINQLKMIEKMTKRQMTRRPIPTFSEALEGLQKAAMDQLLETAEQKEATKYKSDAERLLEHYDSVTLLSAALKLLTKEPDTTPVKLTAEAPLRSKKPKNRSTGRHKGNGKQRRRSKGSFRKGRRRPYEKNKSQK